MRILLQAPILTSSGYGEHSRLVLRSLLQLDPTEVDIFIHPLNWGNTSWSSTDEELNVVIDQLVQKNNNYVAQFKEKAAYDIQIHVGIPNEFKKAAPYSVCVTAGIESDKVAPEWIIKTHQGIDKIIVPSEHAKAGFIRSIYDVVDDKGKEMKMSCSCPVDVIPYPHKTLENTPVDLNIETDFNFLAVAQLGPRKNINNMIKWFLDVYGEDASVGLVLKISHGKSSHIDKENTVKFLENILESYENRKCKIYLIHGNLTDSEMLGLYNHEKINALISLTHGEGYGLPLFEAAGAGLPILATDWSAHIEFLTGKIKQKGKEKVKKLFARVEYDLAEIPDSAVWKEILIKDSKWAYPRESSFKKQLKLLKTNYGMYKKWASALQEQIRTNYKESVILARMAKSIFGEEMYDIISPVPLEEIPKVSIITSVYDGDEYIEQFMKDITSQSIFKEKCELVILNANSPGNEEEVILKYKEKYPDNIVYEKLEKDPGIYGTWNKAIEMSTGDFITNANLDDRKSRDSLRYHAVSLLSSPEADLVYTDMLITDKVNETWENNTSNGRRYNMPEFSLDSLKMMNMPHAAPMWRRSLHDKYGLFDDEFRSAGDWEMWLRAASQGSVFKKAPGVHNLYCFNPKGVSTNPENFSWKQEEEKKVHEKYNQ